MEVRIYPIPLRMQKLRERENFRRVSGTAQKPAWLVVG
jgi:hypothetical protein